MTQLALQLEPSPVDTAAALDEMVAESDRAVARVLLPCFSQGEHSSISGALAHAAEWQRCRERPRDLGDRLMAGLELANRRADEDLQLLRELHAELEGVPVDQLDKHLAAREAEEKRMREEARAENPARASSSGKAAMGSAATIGIGRAALSERQRELLAFVRVENNVAIFSNEERVADWHLLKRIIEALGGTWKTGGKKTPGGFHFPDDLDAAELVRLAKETGEITDPKAAELFETPMALGAVAVERLDVRPGMRVLEPSAGRGALLRALLMAQPSLDVQCVEPLSENIAGKLGTVAHGPNGLLKTGCCTILQGDFLLVSPGDPGFSPFARVLMNPPFSRRQDIQHVRHAYKFLEPGGVLVAIMSAGVKFRDDKLAKEFRAFVAENRGDIWDNPDGSFLESGTGVRTVMVRVRRPA